MAGFGARAALSGRHRPAHLKNSCLFFMGKSRWCISTVWLWRREYIRFSVLWLLASWICTCKLLSHSIVDLSKPYVLGRVHSMCWGCFHNSFLESLPVPVIGSLYLCALNFWPVSHGALPAASVYWPALEWDVPLTFRFWLIWRLLDVSRHSSLYIRHWLYPTVFPEDHGS